MAPPDLAERQRIEIEYWRNSPSERPEADSLDNLLHKMGEARIFLDLLRRQGALFAAARHILELGGGQGWAACIVKRHFSEARVVTSDISEHAVASLPKWERVFQVKLDDARACLSYQTGQADASQDLVFCFASAHHFQAQRRTLAELQRILRPGGSALYLYEPACSPLLHRPARWRVNRKRPAVPEDVLVHRKLRRLATEAGLECEVEFYPSLRERGPGALLYYAALARLPWLQPLLACTANFHFRKPAEPSP